MSKAESKIENLTDSIATTTDKGVRSLLENKLTGILEQKEQLQKAERETGEQINALERSANNVQERIEDMQQLTAYLKKAKPREVIDIRLKLREAIRATIGEITLFSRGFRDRKHVNEYESNPDRRKVFYEGIDNKAWRFYRLGLKGSRFTRACYPQQIRNRLRQIDSQKTGRFL